MMPEVGQVVQGVAPWGAGLSGLGLLAWIAVRVSTISRAFERMKSRLDNHDEDIVAMKDHIGLIENKGSVKSQRHHVSFSEWRQHVDRRMDKHSESIDVMRGLVVDLAKTQSTDMANVIARLDGLADRVKDVQDSVRGGGS